MRLRYLPLSRWSLLTTFCISAFYVACSQERSGKVWSLGNDQVRVVFASKEAMDSAKAQHLIEILDEQAPLRGLPGNILRGGKLTISLAAQPVQGVDALSYPVQRLIILSWKDAFEWEAGKLRGTIRHELAHIGVGVFLNHAELPAWFEEGFAEWSAGRLKCEGETRIAMEMMIRRHQGRPPPPLFGTGRIGRTRLGYDFLATFIDFIDVTWGGVVEDGTLLESIKLHGFDAGLSRVLGADLEQLEEYWHSFLVERYDGTTDSLPCDADGY